MKISTIIKENVKQLLPLNNNWIRYFYYPRFRNWINEHKNEGKTFDNRYQLYDYLNNVLLDKKAIDYLEFGVYHGKTIKYWLSLNKTKESRFWGFDTFEGLPQAWKEGDKIAYSAGAFDAGGNIPQIEDNRVSFIKGLFQETLDDFLISYQPENNLIIHNDSDLYSSSLYLLTRCNSLIKPGTIIIFDELSSWMNEFKALEEYCIAYNKTYKILAKTKNFSEVALIF